MADTPRHTNEARVPSGDARRALTVEQLLDIVSRAHSAIMEGDDTDEHAALRGDLNWIVKLAEENINASHMGCAGGFVLLEHPLDDEALCAAVASWLTVHGIPAHSEQTGGGIMCVFVHVDEETDWIFGMANETWAGDLVDRADGSLHGEGTPAERHLTTDVSSDSRDAVLIAQAIRKAVQS